MDYQPLLPPRTACVGETLSGRGTLTRLPTLAAQNFGPRGFIITGRHSTLEGHWRRSATGEPTTDEVDALRTILADAKPDWVAAIGGGSVLDLAKAATGLCQLSQSTAYYQAHPEELRPSSIPLLAAPTTAGTGSEATTVSVLTCTEKHLKASIRHPSWLARLVVLDADTLNGAPREVIVHSGLDAYTQAYESLVSRYATPYTQQLSRLGLATIRRTLPQVAKGDYAPAQQLLEASYLVGVAFAQSHLGVVHGLAHPLGARYHIPHGACCAACLPAAVAFNQIYKLDLSLLDEVGFRNPFCGKTLLEREQIVAETLASGSTRANPRTVSAADAAALLETIFGV
ncbi:MAG: iron-containing alcohol dehydrogenase [Kiritimatiellia bacterium]|nr:iron-containing alcohol dehydrogenase [Kiritimatiellia bacterium]